MFIYINFIYLAVEIMTAVMQRDIAFNSSVVILGADKLLMIFECYRVDRIYFVEYLLFLLRPWENLAEIYNIFYFDSRGAHGGNRLCAKC